MQTIKRVFRSDTRDLWSPFSALITHPLRPAWGQALRRDWLSPRPESKRSVCTFSRPQIRGFQREAPRVRGSPGWKNLSNPHEWEPRTHSFSSASFTHCGGRGDPGVALHSPSSDDRGAGDGSCSTGGPRLLKLWFKVRAES